MASPVKINRQNIMKMTTTLRLAFRGSTVKASTNLALKYIVITLHDPTLPFYIYIKPVKHMIKSNLSPFK